MKKESKDIYFSDMQRSDDRYEDISSGRRDDPTKPPRPERTRRKRKNAGLRIFVWLLVIILVILLSGLIYMMSLLSKVNYSPEDTVSNQYISDSELASSPSVKNILLLGIDARDGDTVSRTDTMMLISIDTAHKKIKMTSFLRDSWVTIPGHGEAKLNAASVDGGTQLTKDTIEYNFKVKIDNYMLVDFNAFKTVIDDIGGIDIQITQAEADECNKEWPGVDITAGDSVHLNGDQALCYARVRKIDSDFGRTERQRKLITAVKSKLSQTSVRDLSTMLTNLMPQITTDISKNDLLNLAVKTALFYLKYETVGFHVPADGTWEYGYKNGQSIVSLDTEKNASLLYDFIYNDVYDTQSVTTEQ